MDGTLRGRSRAWTIVRLVILCLLRTVGGRFWGHLYLLNVVAS